MAADLRLRITSFSSPATARDFFTQLGSSAAGAAIMSQKAILKAVLIENLDNRAINILKQEMLALGGEAVTSEAVTRFQPGSSDTVLLGTLKHFTRLREKLKSQPFGLKKVGEKLTELLTNEERRSLSFAVGKYRLELGPRPLIMGILNITPDSFSDGGQYFSPESALERARQLLAEGADIIDVGGESSRPGAAPVPLAAEQERVWPIIEALAPLGIPLSVDTYKAEIAAGALKRGAVIVNDISALNFDPRMAAVVAQYDAALVLMHMQGTPQNMQRQPTYQNLLGEIMDYLASSREKALVAGVDKNKIIFDPGIGFGKTLPHNLEILKRLAEFKSLGQPLLIGTSRKSFLGTLTGKPVEERLLATAATLVWAVERGANIVRVHDVGAAKELLQVTRAIDQGENYQIGN